MTNATTTQLRHFALLAIVAIATLGSGCGFFENAEGPISQSLNTVSAKMAGLDVELDEYSDAGVEVYVEDTSLVLDFSNIDEAGEFSADEFEGYTLEATDTDLMVAFDDVSVDEEASTVRADDIELDFDGEQVVVNLHGLSYDDTTFIKIDLVPAQ